jgi:hypothetical protein
MSSRGSSRLSSLVTVVLLVAVIVGLYANQNRLFDWWRLRGYTPPASVVQLANETTLNDYSRHIFYINKPSLATSVPSFRRDCPQNEDTIVLGCYHSVQNGIYVYNVPDPALAGVQQVTAAHETLHAVYDRLGSGQRAAVNQQLRDFYAHGLTDQRVKDEIKIYEKTEPTEVTNEMHSIFGTEVANLPAPLEAYYKQYFNDRSKVVQFEEQYQAQFTERQATITADDKQLAILKKEIDSDEASLGSDIKQISIDRAQINGYVSANDVSQYNAAVPAFNRKVDAYNRSIADLRAKLESYNQLVAARNQIASQLTTLDKALDTRTMQQQVNH